jgi:hypothetical protein
MRNLVLVSAVSLIISPVASAPAFAQSSPAPQQPAAKQARDPNEIVCERVEETGSRLSAHKVCMTRSQWAEQRRLTRQDVEKAQTAVPYEAPQ